MTSPAPHEVARILDLVGPLYRQAVRRLETTGELPVGVRALLDLLRVRDELTVPRVAEVLGLSRQFVQRCANEAEAAGWVERGPNPEHRRSALLRLTTSGRARIDAVRTGEAAALAGLAATLTARDVEACTTVLTRLLSFVRDA